jgi:hypothetical protein
MLSMMKALRGSITRSASSPARRGFASASGLPRSSTIFNMKYGCSRKPPLANTE